MLSEIYIVITDINGDTVIGRKENIGSQALKRPSEGLLELLREDAVYHLIKDAEELLKVRKELSQ